MASETPQASQVWHHALKLRKHILKQAENVSKNGPSDAYVAQFEAIEGALEKFRLACVQTIFMDFEFAAAQNAEEALWTVHTNINSEYRRCAGRLKQSSHAVERRKVDKLYNNFLRVSQKFYKGYIQRISARYDIPELKRVAQGMDMEQLEASDAVSPVPTELQEKVLRSCHATLIRLGDLARYRTQAKQKHSSYDSALVCYNLAHHLMPDSGFAFHQMGIVNLDQANHLDVVYHFYRAWAIKSPHPNAKQNLEMEFKAVLSPESSKTKSPSPVVQDAFSMWFVRLHACFYKGEQFPQHKELEDEVIHRLELAAKNPSSRDNVLKMMLINISAYHIASSRYTADTSSKTAAMFYQFILRFNVRFFWTICTVIANDLESSFASSTSGADTSQDAKMGEIAEALLPTFRLYCVWFCSNRADIFDPNSPSAGQLLKTMCTVFSLLCTETYSRTDLASSPYLLAEDVEIRGLEPLCPDKVPQACRCFCLDDGTLKPNLYNPEQRMKGDGEKMARILDILRCAYFLSEDAGVPLAHQVTNGLLVFEYTPLNATTSAPITNNTAAQNTTVPEAEAPVQQPSQPSNATRNQTDAGHPENTVMNMLSPFLKPPTPNQLAESSEQDESSYGMHTATANEVFASIPTDPSPARSISSAKFQPLPWDWFNAPRPENAATMAGSGGRAASLSHVNPGVSPNVNNNSGARRPDDPFYSPAYQQARSASMAMSRTFSGGGNQANPEEQHRAQLLDSFQGDQNRVSPFREWTNRMSSSEQIMQANWSPGAAPTAMPNSSSVSDFSNLSSIYQGTPANALGIESNMGRSIANGHGHNRQASYGDRVNSQHKPLRMDDKRTNYDEAILRSAYQGNR